MKGTNKKIVIFVIFIILILGSTGGVVAYNNIQTNNQISKDVKTIENIYKKFDKETDRTKKLNVLKDVEKKFDKYKKGDNYSEVNDKYSSKIKLMKKYFIADYDNVIKQNTVDVNTTDKNTLINTKTNLDNQLKLIQSETITTKKQLKKYQTDIKKLTDSYNAKISELEAKEKEEAKKAQQLQEQAKSNSSKSNSSSSKSGNSSSTSGGSGSYYSYNYNGHTSTYDPNGNGDVYSDGEYGFNLNDQFDAFYD